jgi:hypothetical protein
VGGGGSLSTIKRVTLTGRGLARPDLVIEMGVNVDDASMKVDLHAKLLLISNKSKNVGRG